MSYPERPLGEILTQVSDFVKVDAGKVYDTIGIYSYGRGIIRRPTIDGTETSYSSFNRIHSGQFIYSKLFGWEGALAVVRPEHEGLYASPEFPTFELDQEQVDFNYFAHLVTWPKLHSALRSNTTGMGSRRQRVNVAQLLNTTVPLPGLPEQGRIAAKLDAAIGKLERVCDLRAKIANLRAGFLEATFNRLREETHRTLGELVEFERVSVELHEDKEYVQVGIRSFGRGIFHRPPMRPSELSKLRYFKIIPDRLVVSNIMAWEGAIALSSSAEEGCIGSSRFLSFAPKSCVNLAYLNYYFQTRKGRLSIASASTGTVKRNQTLSVQNFERIAIPVPDVEAQNSIVHMIDLSERRINALEKFQSDNAEITRKALLNAAFTGQL